MSRWPLLLSLVLFAGCASSVSIKPVYTTQSSSLIKGEIALRFVPYEGGPKGDPYTLGIVRLEERIDDFFKGSLIKELGAFGFAVKDDARLELTVTLQKADSTLMQQGKGGVYTTIVRARFTVRDRLKGNAVVYDQVQGGDSSQSYRYSGRPASASLVEALATAYGRFLSDASFYDKLVKEYGYSKSERQAASAAGGGPAKGEALEIGGSSLEAFPILAKYYDDHPIGKARIRDRLGIKATNLRISFFVPSYMDAPKECAVIAELRDSADFDLYALFNDKILRVTEGTKAAAAVTVDYAVDGSRYTQDFPLTIGIFNRNALTWDDDRKAAAFVTAKDPAILSFAKNTTGMLSAFSTGEISKSLLKAALLHEALATFGMKYETDPYSSYTTAKGAVTTDFLQFPRQSLEYRAGDCDDLSVLYSALLESVGVETAFITVPGHIYTAFAIEAKQAEAAAKSNYAGDYILRSGKAWIPVEATLVAEGFLQAWQKGKEEWTAGLAAGSAALYPIHEAWNSYAAVDFHESASALALPDRAAVLSRFAATLDAYVDREIHASVKELREEIEKAKSPAKSGNTLALLYARFGKYEPALAELERVTRSQDYVPALINAGNIHFILKDFAKAKECYSRAALLAPDNSCAILQLSRTLYELKDYSACDLLYERLKKVDTRMASSYDYLSSKGGAKASDAVEPPAWQE